MTPTVRSHTTRGSLTGWMRWSWPPGMITGQWKPVHMHYASASGTYSSLSRASCTENHFAFTLDIPLALGTVGGLTSTHPMAASAMQILGNPSSEKLMQIVAAAGLSFKFQCDQVAHHHRNSEGTYENAPGQYPAATGCYSRGGCYDEEGVFRQTISHAGIENFLRTLRDQTKGS